MMLKTWPWWRRLSVVSLVLTGGFLMGCGYKQHGNSEWGLKHTSTWAFFHETQKAADDQVASFEADFKPLVEHVLDLRVDGAEVE